MEPLQQKQRLGARLPVAPVSFFAMTLGLAETGSALRFAHDAWGISPIWGEVLEGLAVLSFMWWIFMYVNKWIHHRSAAKQEWRDPVQGSFIALIPESVLLLAVAFLPYQIHLSHVLFWTGSTANLLFAAYRFAGMWKTPRSPVQVSPSLFLTYTASVLVNALVAGLLGYTDYGWMLFGIGAISWLVLDSVLLHQLVTGGLDAKTRNFMGIYMAPAAIVLVAYQVLSGGGVNSLTYALAGYALFLAFSLALSYRWLREQRFAPGYWAYTFGVATVAQGLLLMVEHKQTLILTVVAATALIVSILVTVAVAFGAVRLLVGKRYYPAAIK